MKCPYCDKEMEEGIIYGDRFSLKWIKESEDKGPLLRGFQKKIKLSDFYGTNGIETFYCIDCEKMIIDVENSKYNY